MHYTSRKVSDELLSTITLQPVSFAMALKGRKKNAAC